MTRKSITEVSLSYAKFICDRRSSTFIIGYVKLSRWFGRDEATITISIHIQLSTTVLYLNFMSLFYVYACMYCMNCCFIDNVVRLLFYVNMCACHVHFTINLLTYLQ